MFKLLQRGRGSAARTICRLIGLGFFATVAQIAAASGAEIKVMAPRAIVTILREVGGQFESATGYKLNVSADLAADVVKRVNAGEEFDIAVALPAQIEALVKDGKLLADSHADLVRSGIGVEVRKGAPKPDISTVEAFKQAMLQARSIGYTKFGQGGRLSAGILQRVGLSEALKSKIVTPETDIVSELVAEGKIEIGMVILTQILTTPGVELVGPVPPELQAYVVLAGGVSAKSKAPDVARELIKFLKGPAVPVIRAQGMEPG